jgi:flagellar biosynthesis protein FliR
MLISIAQAQVYFLAFTRVMAMIMAVPVLGSQTIPTQVRLGLGLVLTAVLIPWQPLGVDVEALGLFGFAGLVFQQLLIGVMASMAALLTFGALQIAGEMMGIGSGFGSGRLFNPTLGESGSAVDQLFIMTGMLIFVILNGHHTVIQAVQQSFVLIPLRSVIPFESPERLLTMTAGLISTGIQMALPVMCAIFLADLALGLLARVAPQVQVYFLGLPLKIGLGMIVFSMTFAIVLPTLRDMFRQVGPRMLNLLGL